MMKDEWIYLETRGAGTDEVYGRYQHTACGQIIEVLQGHTASLCPKCHPEEWTIERRKDAAYGH